MNSRCRGFSYASYGVNLCGCARNSFSDCATNKTSNKSSLSALSSISTLNFSRNSPAYAACDCFSSIRFLASRTASPISLAVEIFPTGVLIVI